MAYAARGGDACPVGARLRRVLGAPLARSEARVALKRLLDRTTDIRISEEHHGPPGARRYDYRPTELIRGMLRLHLEYSPADTVEGRV